MHSIPKKIHYVWLGDSPKNDFILKCIDSWKKYFPDFEIKEWNNDSFSFIKNDYALEAFNNRKWAFASDYIRLYALYHEGGIYLDTDVEVTNTFENFMHLDFFTSHEIHKKSCFPIASAVIGAQKGNKIIGDLLHLYSGLKFKNNNEFDLMPITIRITNYFEKAFNFMPPYNPNGQVQLMNNAIIFPSYYFCMPEINKNNYAIHHFMGSWLPDYARRDKLTFFKKIILTRFSKRRDSDDYGLKKNEKLLFKFKISSRKEFALILKH
ncbi:glycosyltransferase family 32 protein [Frischella japonica]|uniref:glycosyltransferase family 32 protein n=1 Tax=Frischella japonica TaxID=2741544 RepID=UPI001FEC6188|nr:glycosyltransferase [Frischella japonica]